MFELAADELAEDIKAVSYDHEDFYKFGDELLELPFPFLRNPPRPCFTMVSTDEKKALKSSKEEKAFADYITTEVSQKKGSKTE